jgi:hypothetical protein
LARKRRSSQKSGDDVEREGRFPRPRDADDRRKPAAQRDVDVRKIVLGRALDVERPRVHAINHRDFVPARDARSFGVVALIRSIHAMARKPVG